MLAVSWAVAAGALRRGSTWSSAWGLTGIVLSLSMGACKPAPEGEPARQEVVAIGEAPEGAREARPCGEQARVTYVDVRREPAVLGLHGEYLYWVDRGNYTGPRDAPKFVEDGAIWRMRRDGDAPEKFAEGLGWPIGMVVNDAGVLVADRRDEAHGMWLYPRGGGAARQVWSGGPVKQLVGEVYVKDGRVEALWQGIEGGRELLADAGYVEAIARDGERIAVGGLVDGNTFDGIVTVLQGGKVERRLSFPKHWVKAAAFEGDDLLLGVGSLLLRMGPEGNEAVVERVAIDEIEQLTVHDAVVFWVATRAGPHFSLRAGRRGGEAVELASGDGAAWRFVVDDETVYFVESAPVKDPWTKLPTPYRMGRVRWRACLHGASP